MKRLGPRPERADSLLDLSICLFCGAVTLSIAGANIGWGLITAALLLRAWSGNRIPWTAHRSAIEIPLYIFLAVSLVTALLGVDPANSLRHLNQDVHKVWLYLLFITALSARRSEHGLFWMAAGFAVASAVGAWQMIPTLLGHPVDPNSPMRAHAFVHPVTYGGQMSVAALGALCFALRPCEGWSKTRRRGAAAALAIFVTAMLLSNTRAAILAFVLGGAGICMLFPRLRRYALLALPAGAAAFILLEWANPHRSLIVHAYQLISGDAPAKSHFARLVLWEVAVQIGVDHWTTGVGMNNFRAVLPSYLAAVFEDGTRTWGTAHNLFLHHFAERGLLGLSAVAWLLWRMWKRAFDRARERAQALQLWAFGTTTAFLLLNLTEVALQVEILWMLVFFIWAWAETEHRRAGAVED